MIQAEHRFVYVAEKWCKELDEAAELGGLSYNTVRTYRGSLKNWVLPALGNLQMREVTVTACDKLAKRALAQASYDTAKTVKAVMNGVCAYAVRHDAILINPVQSVGRLTRGGSKEVLALDRDQRKDLLSKLRDYGPTRQNDASGRSLGVRGQVWLDLPDIMEAMLSTGVRLGELLALHSPEVDPQAATVNVNHRLIRITGQGLVRQPHRKSSRTGLLLKVPQWSIPMWSSRKLASDNGPLFHSFTGEHLDPANVINRISEAMNAVGYGWVTSHVFRKTVGTVLDEAGLSTTAIADQLGNTRAVAERHYRRPRAANQANADALEDMM
ncbi:site-specific integrase [Saccharomonospora sp. NPDC046836]|uniref:tyrosine-type recombinase/integrase n=1 Tax=Saccharomonospora sp. NPDC046836 TaxID=3156921 RepID=UPI003402FD62